MGKKAKNREKVKWVGKPKEEKKKRETNKKNIEDRIAEWLLDPEAKYPWDKRREEEEMETHGQYLSMAGIMYESIKENWKKTGREKKIIKEMHTAAASHVRGPRPEHF